ncbi:MAG: hypothetical protein A2Y40_06635 [Candidatus Margulisbacteria bacterium GWF2_35_9]|nr:MAG: hypothetical protein A2Y40_06635 [Candidatus Margulisbacteria bacterium GWF2_35_9]
MFKLLKYQEILQMPDFHYDLNKKWLVVKNITMEHFLNDCVNYYASQNNYNVKIEYTDLYNFTQRYESYSDYDHLIFLLRLDEWVLPTNHFQGSFKTAFTVEIKGLFEFLKSIQKPILFFNFELDYNYSIYENENNLIKRANSILEDNVKKIPQIRIIDINYLIGNIGRQYFYDKSKYYTMGAPYSFDACNRISYEIVNECNTDYCLKKKCLVLDCDDILWGGTAADIGINNISLGQISYGKAYIDFQKEILRLHDQGVVLALCSKNDEQVVLDIFQNHPDMILQIKHISYYQINWNNKVDNLISIAHHLNFTYDTIVYIDDNEYEIGLINDKLPLVTTILMDKDKPYLYADILKHSKLFITSKPTLEAKNRSKYYADQARRENEFLKCDDIVDYHKSLKTCLEFRYADGFILPRLVELSQRTNQFNLTVKRYTEQELLEKINAVNYNVIYIKAKDIYGDMGIVGFIVIRINNGKLFIEAFFLSCRVFGRNFENAFLETLRQYYHQRGFKYMYGQFILTDKNKQFQDFYLNNGFIKNDDWYEKNLNDPIYYSNVFKKISII